MVVSSENDDFGTDSYGIGNDSTMDYNAQGEPCSIFPGALVPVSPEDARFLRAQKLSPTATLETAEDVEAVLEF